MTRALLMSFCDYTDPSSEGEFNEWFNEIHVPDMLAVPGIVGAQRYESIRRGKDAEPKYMAIFEIQAEEPREVIRHVLATMNEREAPAHIRDSTALRLAATYVPIED